MHADNQQFRSELESMAQIIDRDGYASVGKALKRTVSF